MYQKDLAKQAWQKAGLYRSTNPNLRAFLRYVDEVPEHCCWPDLVQQVRQDYPDIKASLAMPLWQTGDKLLRLNLIQAADPHQPDEMDLLHKLVRRMHVVDDLHELRAVMRKRHPELMDMVARKKGLNPEFRRNIQLEREIVVSTMAPVAEEGDKQ